MAAVNRLQKQLFAIVNHSTRPPLTLTLSPLRGEGTAIACSGKFHASFAMPLVFSENGFTDDRRMTSCILPECPPASPSPLNGERAGVRGGYFQNVPKFQKSPSQKVVPNLS